MNENTFFKPKNIAQRRIEFEEKIQLDRQLHLNYFIKFWDIILDIRNEKLIPQNDKENEIFQLLNFCSPILIKNAFSAYDYVCFEVHPTVKGRQFKQILFSCNIKRKHININNHFLLMNYVKQSNKFEFEDILKSVFFTDKYKIL